jgi:hypothetical protein
MQYFDPCEQIHPTSYVPTVAAKRHVSTLTGCLTDASASAGLHSGWFKRAKGFDRRTLRCDKASRENAVRSARSVLENGVAQFVKAGSR